jgi:AmmeMemoRadiSam system protein B
MSREPAVAGTFYPADQQSLRRELENLTEGKRPPSEPQGVALIVPHAGYIYSGAIAAATFTATHLARRIIILGPNHTGTGEQIAVMEHGSWRTPLGEAHLDTELASEVLTSCRAARVDESAHRREHSLEVQLPFLQFLLGEFRFLPICVGTSRLDALMDLGVAIARVLKRSGEPVLLVLSSDMSHYLPATVARGEDEQALAPILTIDPEGLHRVVTERRITMCGMAPAVAGLAAARLVGATAARLIAYDHSGTRSGDHESVVGYAGVAIT